MTIEQKKRFCGQKAVRGIGKPCYRTSDLTVDKVNEIYRSFTATEIMNVYSPFLKDPETIKTELTKRRTSTQYSRNWCSDDVSSLDVFNEYPDVSTLYFICDLFSSEPLVKTYFDRFTPLAGDKFENTDEILNSNIPRVINNGTYRILKWAIPLVFTPTVERDNHIFVKILNLYLLNDKYQSLISRVPDYSNLLQPEQRLSKLIELLSLDYTQALAYACNQTGINIEQVKDLDVERFRKIHIVAGTYLAQNNLYAILTDRLNGGENSIFRENLKIRRTGLGICLATPLMSAYYEGIGLALKNNREAVHRFLTYSRFFL